MNDSSTAGFETVPQAAETFGSVPQNAEAFRTVPHDAEPFRTVQNISERTEEHTLTVREVARFLNKPASLARRAALSTGVIRTGKASVDWMPTLMRMNDAI
jgi:hypothetical protein